MKGINTSDLMSKVNNTIFIPSPPKEPRINRPYIKNSFYTNKNLYTIITINKENKEKMLLKPNLFFNKSSYIGYFCKRYMITPNHILKTSFL